MPIERLMVAFLAACAREKSSVIYVSFNSSPQTITNKYAALMPKGDFVLVDCFSSGKGNNDKVFLDFFKTAGGPDSPKGRDTTGAPVHLENPADPSKIEELLIKLGTAGQKNVRYIFDSLTGMLNLWGDEENVVRFFGHICPRLQVKLLRVLQEREFEPVGSARTVSVDVRVVTVTSKDLRGEVRHGRFREDLYYRLNVIPLRLPPLRERREDIPLLINHFLEKFNRENHKNVRKLSRKVLDIFLEYPWPGNVRELENCIERVVVMIEGDALSADFLPAEIIDHDRKGSLKRKQPSSTDIVDIRTTAERLCAGTDDLASARNLLLQTMEETVIRCGLQKKISQRDLAVKLGLSRMTLRKKLRAANLR